MQKQISDSHFQVNHGGEGPNRTIKHIITESALVGNYKSTQKIIERNFLLANETTAHAEPDMAGTFTELLAQYQESLPHVFKLGRKSFYCIEDALGKGHELMLLGDKRTGESIAEDGIDESEGLEKPELDDVVIEL
jgi:hypothetical protein